LHLQHLLEIANWILFSHYGNHSVRKGEQNAGTDDDRESQPEFRASGGVASSSDCWKEYQTVLQFLRNFGKEHAPTARLILLTMVGHEADAYQISYDTGACLYAVNENLAELTRQNILVRRTLASGRFKSTRYRIDHGFLTAKLGLTPKPGTRLERSDDAES